MCILLYGPDLCQGGAFAGLTFPRGSYNICHPFIIYKENLHRFFAPLLCLLCSCFLPSRAVETEPTAPQELLAEDISSRSLITDADGINRNLLVDGNTYYGYASADQHNPDL